LSRTRPALPTPPDLFPGIRARQVDPHRVGPGELAVVLDRPEIVPAQAGRAAFLIVGPLERDLLRLGLGRIDVVEILDDIHPRQGLRAVDEDAELHRPGWVQNAAFCTCPNARWLRDAKPPARPPICPTMRLGVSAAGLRSLAGVLGDAKG